MQYDSSVMRCKSKVWLGFFIGILEIMDSGLVFWTGLVVPNLSPLLEGCFSYISVSNKKTSSCALESSPVQSKTQVQSPMFHKRLKF